MPPREPAGPTLEFVVSGTPNTPNGDTRKLIRSHVMLGKNRGKTHPWRKKLQAGTRQGEPRSSLRKESASSSGNIEQNIISIPRKLGAYTTTVQFPDGVDPASADVVIQFSTIAKKLLFPLEQCILFERRAENWIAPLAFDPVYLHVMIFSARYYFEVVMPQGFSRGSRKSALHYSRSLQLLRNRFESDDQAAWISLPTAAAVMSLAMAAHHAGDAKIARIHLAALKKIVDMRGGVSINAFGENVKLLLEILRGDLGIALHMGEKPAFFDGSSTGDSLWQFPDFSMLFTSKNASPLHKYTQQHIIHKVQDMEPELGQVWTSLANFSELANFAITSGRLISTEIFLEALTSTMYRLLALNYEIDSSNEAIRLGLLAFSSSIFLPWKQVGMSYCALALALKRCLMTNLRIGPASPAASSLQMWLVMVGAVSQFSTTDDQWFADCVRASISSCKIETWEELKEMLATFMWIPLVHDKLGMQSFNVAMASAHKASPM